MSSPTSTTETKAKAVTPATPEDLKALQGRNTVGHNAPKGKTQNPRSQEQNEVRMAQDAAGLKFSERDPSVPIFSHGIHSLETPDGKMVYLEGNWSRVLRVGEIELEFHLPGKPAFEGDTSAKRDQRRCNVDEESWNLLESCTSIKQWAAMATALSATGGIQFDQ